MTQSKFLHELRRALGGKLPAGEVQENITYYENYSNEEMKKGRSEEEVLTELGDPWILAKTIKDIRGGSGNYKDSGKPSASEKDEKKSGMSPLKKGMLIIGVIFAVIAVIMVVRGLMRFIMPIAVPLIAVYAIVKIIKSK